MARAISSRSGTSSIAKMRSAPRSLADCIAKSFTGPAPQIATVEPGSIPALAAAWSPVGRMSVRNSTCSSVKCAVTLRCVASASGTRTNSARPPS